MTETSASAAGEHVKPQMAATCCLACRCVASALSSVLTFSFVCENDRFRPNSAGIAILSYVDRIAIPSPESEHFVKTIGKVNLVVIRSHYI